MASPIVGGKRRLELIEAQKKGKPVEKQAEKSMPKAKAKIKAKSKAKK
jgi:hypothetical protein